MPQLDVRPVQHGSQFGVRISGITMDQTSDPAIRDQVNALFETHGVIVFADVEPSGEMHIALSNIFGPLKEHPSKSVSRVEDGLPGVIDMVSSPHENANIEVGGKKLASWLPWHFDHCYNNELNRAGVLRAIEIPPEGEGGLTGFVDGIELYEALSPQLRAKVEDRNVLYRMNVIMGNYRFGAPDGYKVHGERAQSHEVMEEAKNVPRALHPAVWTRRTGEKVLHISPWMAEGFEGAEDEAGEALLAEVSREIVKTAEKMAYWHSWSPTDMLIWDNWRVLHAVSGHTPGIRRRMQRTTIKGDYGLGSFEGGGSSDAKVLERTY